MRPLEGLKVLDLAWVMAGPVVGRALADFGATVVRVESAKRLDVFARHLGPFPNGEFNALRSGLFENCNAGKLGLALDLSREEGRLVARELATWADVVVESFAPGQMSRFGLDYESIRALNPRVIMLSTSLMGQNGPYGKMVGFGSAGAAFTGFLLLTGNPGEFPVGTFGAYTDFVAPRFSLFMLLAALDHRERTGEGTLIDVAQTEASLQFLAPQIAQYCESGEIAEALGNRDPAFAPHGVFPALGEYRWVAIVARNDAEWGRLAEHMNQAQFAQDPRFATLAARKENENALESIIADWTRHRQAEDIERDLQTKGVPAHVVASSADLVSDPQLRTRGHFVRLPHPLGEAVVESARYELSETPAGYDRSAPPPGRDNDYVLRELLGYSPERIAALKQTGALT
ncbi:CoA transferase [Bradyrhizobium sp. 169]|uniref:CaiB/BaiF CoA transferase family protein n=1 Tax=Bradyrhizobium sp. 169 TaxID=2782640 RepID=UPI001FF80050|nr:CoA transferase [Bradyrhizobium sp. 169]